MRSNARNRGVHFGGQSGTRSIKRRRVMSAAIVGTLSSLLPLGTRWASAASDAWSTSPSNGNFSGTNWTVGSITPGSATGTAASGDTLYFGASSTTTLNNNDSAYSFGGLIFNPGANSYNISGNSFTLNGSILNFNGSQIITAPIVLGATDSIYALAGATTALSGGISGTGFGLSTFGAGTLSVSGANTYTGTTSVNGGTLSLTGSLSSTALSLGGGNFSYAPASTGTKTFTTTAVTSGGSGVTVSAGSTIALGTITRSTGGAVLFNQSGTGIISATAGTGAATVNGVLPWGITYNSGTAGNGTIAGYNFANISGGNIVAYNTATAVTSGFPASSATTNYDMSSSGTGTQIGSSRSFNTIRFTGASSFLQQDNSAQTETVNAILNTGSALFNMGGGSFAMNWTASTTTNELILASASAGICINNPIINNANTVSLTVIGPNTTTLNGASTFTGGTTVDSGTLTLGYASGTGIGTIRGTLNINPGGTVSLKATDALGYNSGAAITLVNVNGGTLDNAVAGNNSYLASWNLTGGTMSSSGGGAYNIIGSSGAINSLGSPATSTISGNIVLRGGASALLPVNVARGPGATDLLISGIISQSGDGINGIAKNGAGIMVLTAANTYAGATNISGGTLQLGDGTSGHDGTIANTSIVNDNASLVFNHYGNVTAPYPIGGAGTITKLGAGNLTSTNAWSNTGGTTVSAGTLTIGSGGSITAGLIAVNAGTLTLASGGTITGGQVNVSGGTFAASGSQSVSAPVVVSGGTISTVDSTINTFSFNGGLNVSGGTNSFLLEANGSSSDSIYASTLAIGSSGATVNLVGAVGGQTYTIMNYGSATYNGTAFTSATGVTSADGLKLVTPFGVGGTFTINGSSVQVVTTTGGTAPASAYWTGAQGPNWTDSNSSGGNFTTTLNGSTLISALPASSSDVFFANSGAINLTNTLGTANFDIHTLNVLGTTTGAVTINNGSVGNTLTLEGGLNVSNGAGTVTINATNLILNNDQTWNSSSANAVIVSSNISGSHALTLTGGGTFNFSNGTNAYTNGTVVTGGSNLTVAVAGSLGAAGSNVVLDNGTLTTTNNGVLTLANPITINASGGTLTINSNGSAGTGQVFLNNANYLQGTGTLTLQGNGTLSATGQGNLRIGQTNSFSGNVILQNGGSLEYGVSGAISSTLVTINNQGEFITNNGVTNPVNVNVSGGTNSVISFENGNTGILSGNVYLGANAVIGLRNWYAYGTATGGTMTGTITGTGGLNVSSGTGTGGTLAITSSSNTYSGPTIISQSLVNVASLANINTPSSLGTGSVSGSAGDLVLDNGTLAYNGSNTISTNRLFTVTTNGGTINSSGSSTVSFTGSGTIAMSGTGARTFILTGSNTGANTLSPSITDNGGATSLLKTGLGEWVLSGSNTYSGPTTLSAGTLITGNIPNTSGVTVGQAASPAVLILNGSGTNPLGTGTITMDTTGNGSTANFQISGGVSMANPIYFAARNNTSVGIENVSGTNTLSGPLTLGSGGATYIFQSDAGSLNLTNTAVSTIGLNKVLNFQGASGGNVAIPFNGSGGIAVSGTGTWNFSGATTYTGNTTINGGTLALTSTGSLPGTAGINISSGATFDISNNPTFALGSTQVLYGNGTVNGPYNFASGTVAPGSIGTIGTLAVNGNLNLAGGKLALDLDGNSNNGDLLNVSGNLALASSTTLATTFLSNASTGEQFTIIDFGTLTGSLSNLSAQTRGYSLSNTSNSIILTVTSTSAANLNWNSSSSSNWDVVTSQNWLNTTSGMQDFFYGGDNVNFLDTPGVQQNISLVGNLSAGSVNVNTSSNSYTFGGTGSIVGSGALTKYGSTTLTINTSNNYSGGTFIYGGTIAINSNTSLGAVTGTVTIGAGTLESTASINSTRPIVLSSPLSTIQVDPGMTFTTTAAIADGTSPGTLIKTGTGTLVLNGSSTYSGGTNISAGTVTTGQNLGAANSSLLIGANGTLDINGGTYTNTVTGTGNIVSTGGTISGDESGFAGTFTHSSSTASTSFTTSVSTSANAAYVLSLNQGSLQGFLAGNGGLTLNIGSLSGVTNSLFRGAYGGTVGTTTLSIGNLNTPTTFYGNIQDGGNVLIALTKVGTSSLTLAGTDAYSQGTNVSNGSLIFASAGAYPTNSPLNIASGALVQIANHGSNTAYTPQLSSLNNGGTIDLTNNALIVHNGAINTIWSQVAAAYNHGAWNLNSPGGAITSSTAAADGSHLTALGVETGLTFQTSSGVNVVPSDVVVKYTFYGDANLDGHVDGSDYSRIDNGVLMGLTGWSNGDFNYDGVINGSDYTLIDNAYNTQGASLAAEIASPTDQIAGISASGVSAVPEPTSLGMLALGAVGLLGRRRRRMLCK